MKEMILNILNERLENAKIRQKHYETKYYLSKDVNDMSYYLKKISIENNIVLELEIIINDIKELENDK